MQNRGPRGPGLDTRGISLHHMLNFRENCLADVTFTFTTVTFLKLLVGVLRQQQSILVLGTLASS